MFTAPAESIITNCGDNAFSSSYSRHPVQSTDCPSFSGKKGSTLTLDLNNQKIESCHSNTVDGTIIDFAFLFWAQQGNKQSKLYLV